MSKLLKKEYKGVSNDRLARMIARGFVDVDKRFDEVHAELATKASKEDVHGVETRLDRVETRLTGVETRLDGVETHINGLEFKVDRALYSEYTHLERRVSRLEKKAG
ncbi:MAG: hypothetical protein Q8Q20_02675 [bacterium]|nr:hypothetical protein [bacterium]